MFEAPLDGLREHVTQVLCYVELRVDSAPSQEELTPHGPTEMHETRHDPAFGAGDAGPAPADRPLPAHSSKVPRNAPCPCGSGKKYKHCHGSAG